MSGGVRTGGRWFVGIAVGGAIWGAIAFSTNSAQAQITPDKTLPNNSTVRLDGNTHVIEGGTRAGGNLFHSFGEFSVRIGETAHFNNAVDIQNIFGRVTGGAVSNIDGILRANGTANLFLINPNGIVFGKNASLNIGGSFVASTASSLKFADGFEFSAKVTQTTPLLTVSVPTGLQYGGTAGSILNQSRVKDTTSGNFGLGVQPGNTLALVGGNVSFDGGGLTARGGRVELGGVTGSGTVDLSVNGNDLHLSFPNGIERADVSLTNANIYANTPFVSRSVPEIPAGSIAINARNIDVSQGGYIGASGDTSSTNSNRRKAGEITLNATETISVTVTAERNTSFQVDGNRGVIKIKSKSISLTDSFLSTVDFGGNAGDIFLQADDAVSIANSDILSNSSTEFAGEIDIQGKSVSITGPSQINAFATFGVSGTININASDAINISGSKFNTSAMYNGRGGNINIKASSVFLSDGTRLNASTTGNSPAGNIVIKADSVTLSGVDSFESSSGLFTSTDGVSTFFGQSGKGGDIRIDANTLRVLDKAVVSARTRSDGNGGNITVNTNNLEVTGGGQILTSAFGSGSAGNITVNSTNKVTISGSDPTFTERSTRIFTDPFFPVAMYRAEVDNDGPASGLLARVRGNETANAGNIGVTSRSIRLDNGAILSADTKAAQGNITLNSRDLVLLRGSNITTNATGTNVIGGNINIDTDVLAAAEKSNISANSADARGGRVIINTQGLFRSSDSNITANGANPQLNGIVQINTPDVDPSRGLVQLPTNLFDASSQIDNSCNPGSKQQASSFVVTGRGGLPPNPRTEPLTSDAVQVDWVSIKPSSNNHKSSTLRKKPTPTREPIVQATGWTRNSKGEVVLTADASNVTPPRPGLNPAFCHGSRNN